jgi:hypothetical protein
MKRPRKRLTGVRRDRPQEDDEDRPLWGDHWNFGSFWDALMVVRSRIETAARALHFADGEGPVAVLLEDAAEELRRLAKQAHGELDGAPGFRRKGGGDD